MGKKSGSRAGRLVRFVVLTGLAHLTCASAASGKSLAPKDVVVPELSAELKRGQAAYDRFCAECHGLNLAGTNKGPTFLQRVYHPGLHGDRAFFVAPVRGVKQHHWRFGDMKPVAGIRQEDIIVIIPYVRALQQANGLY